MADAPDGGSADARVDAEPSALARASMPVYVGGYLALYGMGDEGELVLTREQVARALPPAAPLPINIDHASACEVGAVLALADDDAGLFFVGVINCPQLADTLAGVAHPAFFGADAPSLTPRERFLYLVSNYLPSVSLSSRRLAPDEEADGTLFAHVALCVLGRRVGTIVTYDATPDACVAPFRRLSPRARRPPRQRGGRARGPRRPRLAGAPRGAGANAALDRREQHARPGQVGHRLASPPRGGHRGPHVPAGERGVPAADRGEGPERTGGRERAQRARSRAASALRFPSRADAHASQSFRRHRPRRPHRLP